MAYWSRWKRKAPAGVMIFLLVVAGIVSGALGQIAPKDTPLVTDVSAHLISINSSFTGTELLIYGAVDQPGDVVVVVRGPAQPAVVRRKERVLGVWANRESVRFGKVPTYYAVASNQPLEQVTSPGVLGRLQLGMEYLRFEPEPGLGEEVVKEFRDALIQTRIRAGLFQDQPEPVVFLGPKLFRVSVDLPATVSVGTYLTEVYLFRDGQVISAQSSPLFVNKTGLEQELFELSRRRPALYGMLAIVLSLAAGWTANFVMRRG
jgi:uncharacterized protein (TIGR02186 family)